MRVDIALQAYLKVGCLVEKVSLVERGSLSLYSAHTRPDTVTAKEHP